MKYTTTRLLFSLVLAVCSLALFSADTQAATYTVTKTADDGTSGSLREAITRANSSSADDTINFAIPNCTGNSICTITLTSGEFAINGTSTAGKLTITNATGASRLLISGNNQNRIFYLNYGADLTLDGVTVTAGNGTGLTDPNSNGSGGAIFQNYGSKLMLTNSAVTHSTASNRGGGIYIWSYLNASLTMMNSTVSGNTGYFGGGIQNDCGSWGGCGNVKIFNSTLSGNRTQGNAAAAIHNSQGGKLTLMNVTITNNQALLTNCSDCTGGIYNYREDTLATVNLVNSIVAGNVVASASAAPDICGTVLSTSSHNVIGSNKLLTGIVDGANGNQIGTPFLPINPQLSPLGYNGGATETHALQSLSPAIDRGGSCVLAGGGCDGSNPALTSDQRGSGFPRQSGGAVDVGAMETAQTAAGFDVSGSVVYGTTPAGQPQKSVPGVTVSALGISFLSTTTDSTGYYMLRNLIVGGNYTVTPSKTGSINGITSFDATLILRHVATGGTGGFTANQRTAADIDGDGAITSFDATQLLRFVAAGSSSRISGEAGNWKFTVSSRRYGSTTNSISGENYDGILVGDVNGDWIPAASLAGGEAVENNLQDDKQFDSLRQTDTPLRVSLPDLAMFERGTAIFPLNFTNNSGTPISSFSFAVAYDPNVLQPDAQAIDFTDVLSNDAGCAVVTDNAIAGRIGIAVSCPATGITSAVTQLNLRFTVVEQARKKSGAFPALTFQQEPIFEDGDGQALRAKVVSFSGK